MTEQQAAFVIHKPECPSVFDDTYIPCICDEVEQAEQRVTEQLLKAATAAAVDGFAPYRETP